MSYFDAGHTFSNGEQVTSILLNLAFSGMRLGSDSVDGTTITVASGVLLVGVLGSSNYGAGTITSTAFAPGAVDAAAIAEGAVGTSELADDSVTAAKLAPDSVVWDSAADADKAAQSDMQSETGSHFVSPDVLKYHPGIAKAYGSVSIQNGTTTITGGYNVTSASDTGTSRRITLAVTMANTNYTVVALYKDSGAVANSVGWEAVSATQFDLHAGAEASGRAISFVVYGQLA